MAKYLVGYDGSDSAKAALARAAEMTAAGDTLGVISVAPIVAGGPRSGGPFVAGDGPSEHRAELTEAVAFLAGHGIEPKTIEAIGDPGAAGAVAGFPQRECGSAVTTPRAADSVIRDERDDGAVQPDLPRARRDRARRSSRSSSSRRARRRGSASWTSRRWKRRENVWFVDRRRRPCAVVVRRPSSRRRGARRPSRPPGRPRRRPAVRVHVRPRHRHRRPAGRVRAHGHGRQPRLRHLRPARHVRRPVADDARLHAAPAA